MSALTGLLSAQPNNTHPVSNELKPPAAVMRSFTLTYPNAGALWTVNDDNTYSAEYIDEKTNMGSVIIYDQQGNLAAVESELHNDAYPVAIALYYIKNYPKEKFTIWSHYDTNDNKTYFAKRDQEVIWFNRDGKYIHTVKNKTQLITSKS